ncbi:flagellar biosynthesis protein FlgN [Buchnera aphidicola (Aphis helianthi)]|uniref:Flagellar biosynthesis protein FlgN n=1 Tax=Buchnera aphidicola (Aphis helianthi) TaxID=2315802 RepID=A0A4D6XKV6_9GAMM|nr:flagellar export chaperone FlgN [Buchnera aphidicola]QCI17153.1 flagellar biosynthesis protein FlgN [Buchnera aphidicola (Aphis helianthi)]
MKKLINTLQKIDNILVLINKIIHEEHINLLDSKTNIKKLFSIIEKKHYLLNKLNKERKIQISLEKIYNVFPPYLEYNELNNYSNKIVNKCIFLNKINLENKKLIKNKFYLNQNFLNLYKSFKNKNNTIYDVHGNL